jgi:ribokinase
VSSGVAPIFVDSSGENRIIVVKGANDLLSPSDIDAASDTLRAADFLILQLEIPLETVYYAISFAKRHGIKTILNPAPALPLDLSRADADYLIPNESEAEVLSGIAVNSVETARAAAKKLKEQGARRVIVTLGENGALCDNTHFPAKCVQPVDTSGAGDAFIGSFSAFLASGLSEKESIERANDYAARSTLAVGTQKSFPVL